MRNCFPSYARMSNGGRLVSVGGSSGTDGQHGSGLVRMNGQPPVPPTTRRKCLVRTTSSSKWSSMGSVADTVRRCLSVDSANVSMNVECLHELQTRAIRIINKAGYYVHTEPLYRHSYFMICFVYMQIMFRAKSKKLPDSIQRFFSI